MNQTAEKQFIEKGISANIKDIRALDSETPSMTGVYKERRSFGPDSAAHIFEVDGELIGVWASSDLDSKLAGEEGKMVRATFVEKQELKGGRTFKLFKVEIAR